MLRWLVTNGGYKAIKNGKVIGIVIKNEGFYVGSMTTRKDTVLTIRDLTKIAKKIKEVNNS